MDGEARMFRLACLTPAQFDGLPVRATAAWVVHRGRAEGGVVNWANFISQCFNGLVLGALLALIASGLTIIYGMLGVLNLAHGAMFMLGGYAGYMAFTATGSFLVAVAAGALALMVFGLVL